MKKPERHDVGESVGQRKHREKKGDKKVDREAVKVRGRVRRDLILMAALFCGLLGFVWWQGGKFTDDLRDNGIAGCERQNDVREVLRGDLRDAVGFLKEDLAEQRQSATRFEPEDFGLTPAEFEALVQAGIERSRERIERKRERIAKLPNVDCLVAYE